MTCTAHGPAAPSRGVGGFLFATLAYCVADRTIGRRMKAKRPVSPERTSREVRRWCLFGSACVGFLLSVCVLWLLLTAEKLEVPVAVLGWLTVPAFLALNTWLAVKCLRTKGDDPFYKPCDPVDMG